LKNTASKQNWLPSLAVSDFLHLPGGLACFGISST